MLVEAFHTEFDQRVVIRILSPAMCDEKEIERFRREARTLAKLESEHVARIFDVGTEADGTFYFVRQYLEGQDLAAHLKKRGRLPLPEAVLYVLQAAEAMAETHSHQIILREMQPQHLFLTQRLGVSHVKVVDFGTAKLLRDAAPPGALGEVTSTTMFGLSPYSSPELVRKAKNVDVRTDIWSLGAILYELLAGKPPFSGEMAALMLAITKDEPVPITQQRPDLPREMDQIIGWCLAKDVDRRFANVHAFAHALLPYAPPEGQVLVTRIGAISTAAREKRPGSVPPPAPGAAVVPAPPRTARMEPSAAKPSTKPPPPPPRPAAGRPPPKDSDSVTQLRGVDLLDEDDEDERIATKIMTSPAEVAAAQKKPGPPARPQPAAGQPPARPGSASPPVRQQPPPAQPAPQAAGGGEAPFERTVFMGNDFVPPSPGPKPAPPKPAGAPGHPMFGGAAQGAEVPKPPAGQPPSPNIPTPPPPAWGPGAPPATSAQGAASPAWAPPAAGSSAAAPPSVLGPPPTFDAPPRPPWGSTPDAGRQQTPMSSVVPAAAPSFGPPPAPSSSAAGTGQHAALGSNKNAGARKAAIAAIAAACVLLPALALFLIFGSKSGDEPTAAADTTAGDTTAADTTAAVSVPVPSTPAPAVTEAPSAPPTSEPSPPATATTAAPVATPQVASAAPAPTGKAAPTSTGGSSAPTSKPAATPSSTPTSAPTSTPAAGGGEMGTLVAVAVGGTCAFSVNGASKGSGSSIKVPLKPGSYSVSCKPPSGATKTRSVNVTSGGTAMAMFKLQ